MYRIQRLLDRQGRRLETLSDAEARRFLRAFDDARRQLHEDLRQLARAPRQRFTLQHVRVYLAQVEAGIVQLQNRLGEQLDAGVRSHQERALQDLLSAIGAQEAQFPQVGRAIELEVLGRLSERRGLLLHRHSLLRYGAQLIEEMQRALTVGVARGATWRQVTEQLAGPTGLMAGQRHRAALIVRMEIIRAYNAGHQESLQQAAAVLDEPGEADPLLAKADETRDHRSHPFSRALHGRTRPVDGEWRVPIAEVQKYARRLKKRASGILWRQAGNAYVGQLYPAHFADRGRQVPWRRSWES
ncbi:MAG: hypothetical protein AAFV53_27500 [Myxococcota bacterium]